MKRLLYILLALVFIFPACKNPTQQPKSLVRNLTLGPNAGNFSYVVASTTKTSAGVYNAANQLIRTIWSLKPEVSGTKMGWWDGYDDFGNVPSGGPFHIIVLSSNVQYHWDGVIGNTSPNQTGNGRLSYMFGDATAGVGAVSIGGNEYWALGYNEGFSCRIKTTTSSLSSIVTRIGASNSFSNQFIATDGTNLYWTWADGFNGNTNSGVYASQASTDANFTFSSGATYLGWSVAALVNSPLPAGQPTGLAVQKTNNFLITTRSGINQVIISNKITGVTAQTITTITGPGICVVDASDNLWLADATSLKEYTINPATGVITPTGRSISISNVGGLAISPDGTKIAICDMTAQQVKEFNLSTLVSTKTLGTGVSYQVSPVVANNKFYWGDISGTKYHTFVSYMPDGSILVGDRGNDRIQHFASDWTTFIESQVFSCRPYEIAVDNNNSTRLFIEGKEYAIDYTKPIGSCWTLKNNWGGQEPANFFSGLSGTPTLAQPVTLSNGRTYTMLRGPNFTFYPYELVAGSGLRLAGIGRNFANGYAIDPTNGDLIAPTSSGGLTYRRYALTGFDGSNNPVWSSSFTGTAIPIGASDPNQSNGYNSNVLETSLGHYIAFGQQPVASSSVYHLGSVAEGSSVWIWRALPGTDQVTYTGPFPGQGISPTNGAFFDNGNKCVYGGGVFAIYLSNIIMGYHGEFWKNTQTNYYWHFDDSTGLLSGFFGDSWNNYPNPAQNNVPANMDVAAATGNALSGTLVLGTDGVLYLYQAEEAIFNGVHRWSITGLNTVSHQTATYPVAGPGAPTLPGTDLLSGFSRGIINFASGTGGWVRNTADFNNANGNLTTKTGAKSYDLTLSTDLSITQQSSVAGTNITFDHQMIPAGQRSSSWQVLSNVNWEGNIGNSHAAPPYTGGSYIELLDSVGKKISEVHIADNSAGTEYIVINGQDVASSPSRGAIYRTYIWSNTITWTYNAGTLTINYGGGTLAVTTPFEAGALLNQPYTFRVHFFQQTSGGSANVGKAIDIYNTYFNQTFANTPPVARITGSGSVAYPTTSVTLDGSTSSDADGSIASYAWTNISGPNTPTIVSSTGVSTNITGLIAGTYVFQLLVTDNQGATNSTQKTVVVTGRGPQSFIIGAGSGNVTVNGQGSYITGDSLLIATPTGVYLGLTIKHIKGVYILPQTTSPTFTQASFLCDWNHDTLKYINFVSDGSSTIGIDATCGPLDSSLMRGCYFEGWSSSCINASGNFPYTYGVDSTLKWIWMSLDSITMYHDAKLVEGSFGSAAANVDVMYYVNLTHINDMATTATSGEGVLFHGVCYGCLAQDIRSTSITQRGASGDDGKIYGEGWWTVNRVLMDGGPGYVARIFPMMEYRRPGINLFINNGKFNGTEYGMSNYQCTYADTLAGFRTGTDVEAWGNTMGYQFNDNHGYWSSMFNWASRCPGTRYIIHNNFGWAIGENNNNNNKPQLVNDNGDARFVAGDTTNNQYYHTATIAVLDTTTVGYTNLVGSFKYYLPTGNSPAPLFNQGLFNPRSNTDYFLQPMRIPPDLGYAQFYGTTPPPPPISDGTIIIRTRLPITFITN